MIEAAKKLFIAYPNDLENQLESEIIQFSSLFSTLTECDGSVHIKSESIELKMFNIIHSNNLQDCYPNVEIMLRIYLSMFVTNCTGERSFSKMKIIKDHLRNSMGQQRLSDLTLLSIEYEKLRALDFTDIIHKFATIKARKQSIV